MSIFKKVGTVMLIIGLVASVAACSSKKSPTASGSPSDSASQAPSSSAPTESKAPETFTVTFLGDAGGNVPPKDGIGVKMINDKFHVDYQATIVPGGEYEQKQNAVVATGDLPDMMSSGGGDNYIKWARQGAFLALDDYIKDYPTFQLVPDFIWDQVRVDGKIYGIPRYFPLRYVQTPVIRQDWLDNLGLKMPTNYEELTKVAIAFTKDDPDKNSKDDTIGLTTSNYPYPDFAMGAYWDSFYWYQKGADGNYIPPVFTDAHKELLQFWKDVYDAGAVSKDLPVMKGGDARKAFYSGQAGIYIAGPYDQGAQDYDALQQIQPNAKLAAIPAFVAPDGSQGYVGSRGYYQLTVFSAKLKDEPEKLKRILEMIDFGRKFYPVDQQNQSNEDFDWLLGHAGQGYQIVDGKAVWEWKMEGKAPKEYLPDTRPWAADDADLQVSEGYTQPILKAMAKSLEEMHKNQKTYIPPTNFINSDVMNKKYWELEPGIMAEYMKIITGKRPMSDFDKIKDEYMKKGMKEVIDDVNAKIKEKNVEGLWK